MSIPKTPTTENNMQLSEYLWGILKGKFNQFCAHCTLHGVYYFSDNSFSWLRCVWIVIVCCSMALCCFLSHMIWNKFVVDPTLTVVETTHYSTADIPFPAITMCDAEMVHGPNTNNITNLLILRGYNRSQIEEFYQSFTDIRNKNYTPTAYVRKMHFLLDDLGYPLKMLLETFKKPCGEILLECNWRSRPYDCSEMFRSVYTIKGHCCQFDIPFFKKHVSSETNFVAGVQPTEALDLIVSPRKVSDDGTVAKGNLMLYVFDQKDIVTLMDNAILLTPEAYFDVNVYLWAIDSSSYVRALSLQSRKCVLDTDPETGTSFYRECMSRLILREVVNQCRCLPFEYSSKELDVEVYAACTWDRLICVYEAIDYEHSTNSGWMLASNRTSTCSINKLRNEFFSDNKKIKSKTKEMNKIDNGQPEMVETNIRDIIAQSECYQRCDYVQYEKEVEFIKIQRTTSEVNEITSRVGVHFSETTCIKYRREVLYTWDQMLANLGGIFGLCLGGSIVSVLEIIWFIFDLFCTVLHEAYTKKKVEPKAEPNKNNMDKIFIVNHSMPTEANKVYKISQKDLNAKKFGRSSCEVRYKFIN